MHSATLADEDGAARAHLPANGAGSPQAAFITSAARCKRKAAAAACAGTPAQPREADADGCAAVPTPDAEAWAPPAALALATVPATPVAAPVQSPRPPEDEEVGWEFDPYLFIKRLPSLEECVPPRTSYLLPRRSRRCPQKTLVLDLDETLVHSTLDGPSSPPDFCFSVEVGGAAHRVAVRQRPHLHTFLRAVSALYEVVVFTASQAVYAEQLLDVVDPGRTLIRHRVFRDACVQWEGNYLKDLTVLGRDLAHTLIVDNSPQAFGFQLDNGVPIESWYDDDEDEELLRLLPFLESVAHVDDVRPAIQSRFRLREVVEAVQDPCGDWCA
ncbi:CTD small phosphatase-like protein 2 [Auxenochlorella protothecoides]|uniref:CTD small phosphatase-like protein 2 n=1 Tax=Auxenochlorella protothecoides TaxID=3075 RepID=A0A087SQH6_AUXPR|nr:CTD small phosphatase-like protein 2 [Auxenochlorella protothecoides]KFM27980.1 CTD small phosphatase-like protein 2 [Auxenochlorella protothecoides]